jgi:hypothetical protein
VEEPLPSLSPHLQVLSVAHASDVDAWHEGGQDEVLFVQRENTCSRHFFTEGIVKSEGKDRPIS